MMTLNDALKTWEDWLLLLERSGRGNIALIPAIEMAIKEADTTEDGPHR